MLRPPSGASVNTISLTPRSVGGLMEASSSLLLARNFVVGQMTKCDWYRIKKGRKMDSVYLVGSTAMMGC